MQFPLLSSYPLPTNKIWGCHFHMEVDKEDFPRALVINEAFLKYLNKEKIVPDTVGFFQPGYGAHKKYMWEVRLETSDPQLLEKMGKGALWLAMNRGKLGAYIHPLTHDSTKLDLKTEGDDHADRTLEMGVVHPLDMQFFYDPPIDGKTGKLVDTRTPNEISPLEVSQMKALGWNNAKEIRWKDPREALVNGFHIHVDFTPDKQASAMKVYGAFMQFLQSQNLHPTSTRVYKPKENGPHQLAGWEVKFEKNDEEVMKIMGIALGWLMLNRDGNSVFVHPVTWHEGDVEAEIKAHADYGMVLGKIPPLDLSFFLKHKGR